MLTPNRKTTRKQDCEASHFDGTGIDVECTLVHGGIWLCDACLELEKKADELNTKVIEQAKQIDSHIELSQDIYNSETVPFVDLQTAINGNSEIAVTHKQLALADACSERIDIFTKAIFETKQSLKELENKRLAWQKNMQRVVGGLKEKEQEKYKPYRIDYKPQSPTKKEKTVKPVLVSGTPSKGYSRAESNAIFDAAKKYDVPATTIRAIMLAQKKSAEEAAKFLKELL